MLPISKELNKVDGTCALECISAVGEKGLILRGLCLKRSVFNQHGNLLLC